MALVVDRGAAPSKCSGDWGLLSSNAEFRSRFTLNPSANEARDAPSVESCA